MSNYDIKEGLKIALGLVLLAIFVPFFVKVYFIYLDFIFG